MRNAPLDRPSALPRAPRQIARSPRRWGWLVAALAALVAAPVAACPLGRGHHRGPGQTSDCSGQRLGIVHWEVRASHPAVGCGDSQRVLVEVRLRAGTARAKARRPIAVAIVLDRSGSMQGPKWRDAVEAARAAIRRLERDDVLAIVSYSSDVRVDWPARTFDPSQQDELFRILDRMEPTGSTWLEAGLRRGAEQLARHAGGERPARVLLVSDGNANVGVQSAPGLQDIARRMQREGVLTTTIGLGLDYNEDLMTAVADGGNGSYYYVRDSARLGETFRTEMERMMAVAARRLRVRLQPAAGVRVARVLGYPHEAVGDGGAEIPLGELASDSERSLLVELEVHCRDRGRQRLALLSLDFDDDAGERVRGEADVEVDATDDRRRVEHERDLGVAGRHEEYRLAEEMRSSAEMVSRGEGRAAQQRLQEAARRAKALADRSGNRQLGKAAADAEAQAQAAPAAAAGPAPAREDFKKRSKAEAYQYEKR